MTGKVLIRGGCVLTLGRRTPNYTEADVLVDGDRIAEVGERLRARGAEVIDATDTIVMPGFVDSHRHAWKSLFRNLGVPGQNGANIVASADFGRHYQPEDVYAATLIGLLGALEAGITTVVDWADIQFDDTYTEAALQAHADSGLRTVLARAVPSWAQDHFDVGYGLRRLIEAQVGPSVTIAYGAEDPTMRDLDVVAEEWALARELGLRIHTHVGSENTDKGVVSSLAERGLLGDDVTLVHCSNLGDGEFDAISSSGASVVSTPSSEMATGRGSPSIQQLIDRNIRPGLGVDDERVSPGDIFAQMRATISLQHATHFDLKLAGKGGLPSLLKTRDVIRYATTDGSRASGLGDVTGSLEPGKQADIIVLRADSPNIAPVNDPIGAIVWGMDTSNLDWVFVGGKALLRDGALDADVDRARSLASDAQTRVTAASGLLVEPGSVESA